MKRFGTGISHRMDRGDLVVSATVFAEDADKDTGILIAQRASLRNGSLPDCLKSVSTMGYFTGMRKGGIFTLVGAGRRVR
jgi:hypothetical protein